MSEPLAQLVPDAGDARRAAVLVGHYLEPDTDGLVAVLEEAHDAGRLAELIISLAHFAVALVPELRTTTGRAWLQATITALAGAENAPPPMTIREW